MIIFMARNPHRLMDSGQVLLCNLSKGALGEDVSSLLGSLIVTKLALASLSRQDIPEAERRPHLLYIDEVQNFCHGMPLPTILSESRKYRLSLTIGSQMLSGLPEESVAAIFGNCATIASFRVSGDDAKELVREFAVSGEGVLMADDDNVIIPATRLQDLPDYTFYLRTLSAGRPEKPYVVQSFPPYGTIAKHASRAAVIRTSRERFGRDRRAVEKTLHRFLMAA
jgi:TraM recognition site of TraD and TraG